MTKHTILFLAANPLSTDRLALDEEARAIQDELERSGHHERFELVTRWAVRPLDLLRALRKVKPTVVHFSGHGGRGTLRACGAPRRDIVIQIGANNHGEEHSLLFQGPDGGQQLVSTAALQETFGAVGASVKLVVLSACYSDAQAKVLLTQVAGVVGVDGTIRDDAARSFAIGFYGGLGEGQSVAAAHRQGCAAIGLEGMSDGERPQLKVRAGMDPEQFVLTPIARLGEARGGWLVWVVVAVVVAVCAPAAWLVLMRRADSPPVSLAPLSDSPPVGLARSSSRGVAKSPKPLSPEFATAATLAQPRAPTPLVPTLALSPVPRDCKRTETTSPMCSHRGTLRKLSGTPMSNIKVELMGTDCTVITTELGVFDFKTCNPNQTRRLKRPRIFLHLIDGPICKEVPLQEPPLVTEIRIDLKTCDHLTGLHLLEPEPPPIGPLYSQCEYLNPTICQYSNVLDTCYDSSKIAINKLTSPEVDCESWLNSIYQTGTCSGDDAYNCNHVFKYVDCNAMRKICKPDSSDMRAHAHLGIQTLDSRLRKLFHLDSWNTRAHTHLGMPIPDSFP